MHEESPKYFENVMSLTWRSGLWSDATSDGAMEEEALLWLSLKTTKLFVLMYLLSHKVAQASNWLADQEDTSIWSYERL